MDPLISVIVPIYNVEKYMDKCISSIIGQTYKNIEIILIDDGSKDCSGAKCDEWKSKDDRIKVIHKKNAGLGLTRNTGLENATGEFALFVDSDDFLQEYMVERLYTALKDANAETSFCGFCRYYSDGKIINIPNYYNDETFTGNNVIFKILLEMVGAQPSSFIDSELNMSACLGLYSMNLIKKYGLRFYSEREFISEDIIFNIDYLQRTNKVICIGDCLYFYRVNYSSLTRMYNPERFQKEKILYNEVIKRLEVLMPKEEFALRAQRMFLGRVRSCVMRAVNEKSINLRQEIRKICTDDLVTKILKEYPIHLNPFRHRVFNYFVKYHQICGLILMVRMMNLMNSK